jgi:hypothetical protein
MTEVESTQEEQELAEFFRGFSELPPIKRMGELDKLALKQGLDSDARGKLVLAVSAFFQKCPKNLDVAKKYAADVAKIVVLQEVIDKSARIDLGRAIRDFIEGSKNTEAAGEYAVQVVDIVAGVFNRDKTTEPPRGTDPQSAPHDERAPSPSISSDPLPSPSSALDLLGAGLPTSSPVATSSSSVGPASSGPSSAGPPTAGLAVSRPSFVEPLANSAPAAEPAVSSPPTAGAPTAGAPTAGPAVSTSPAAGLLTAGLLTAGPFRSLKPSTRPRSIFSK